MVDISQHDLVPEHNLLDDEDAVEEILQEYDIAKTDLPKIKVDDPAVPATAEVGDVVEIVRDSRTADRAVVYRLVVK
jgi:DNA-directed RNA polymerase subunit H